MSNNLGIWHLETCNRCLLAGAQCLCQVPDFTRTSHPSIFSAYKSLYEEIAAADQEVSIQSQESLLEKAKEDFERIREFKERHFENIDNQEFRVLEIGPGLGHLGNLIQEEGYAYFATDIVANYLLAFPNSSFMANVEHLPKFEFGFNLIIACDVFEHVLNEGDAILSVGNSLTKNGALYVRSPYLETSINYATNLGAPYPFIHLRTYTKKLLRNLVESAGLDIKELHLGNVVMVSHTRRNLLLRKSNFEKLRKDLSFSYSSDSTQAALKPKGFLVSRLERRYRLYEDKALYSINKTDWFSKTLQRVFFRPAEIWCIASKSD
jgi:hypothetical protein